MQVACTNFHLYRCPEYHQKMIGTAACKRPQWYQSSIKSSKVSVSSSIQTIKPGLVGQSTIKNVTRLPRLTKQEQANFDKLIAMHYFITGTSAYRIEEKHLLQALRLLRPDEADTSKYFDKLTRSML